MGNGVVGGSGRGIRVADRVGVCVAVNVGCGVGLGAGVEEAVEVGCGVWLGVGVVVETAVSTAKTETAVGVIVASLVAQPTQKRMMSNRNEIALFNMLPTYPTEFVPSIKQTVFRNR